MAELARYGHVQPSESDAMTQEDAVALALAVRKLVIEDLKLQAQMVAMGAAGRGM